ncbi:class I SAM-dependent methyltransferase [Psychroflexus sp. CAK57W]|uniref:class I SAM-dependent methyltransferase n=1 Tax=Psychroflexus curvus TaxID=2873595 RepID=UPI001CCB8574|nr:class I SAM-dependent methyltransferase [Psychroflexus curvus]MBZ9628408.1 class I SAM-dependent methyltransferase [Psychroflexus curvus]MBZ9788145.1 class I SAM-dependent methyltransferase [Psychroflexus curvus]
MDYQNKKGKYYINQRPEMLEFFPKNAKTVLDVGCGQGTFVKQIKDMYHTETWGIEYMRSHGEQAEKVLDKVFIGECEKFIDDLPNDYFDVIYFNDVMEHLIDPYMVLDKMKKKLTKNGQIISSLPNIRYHNVLKMFILNKEWKYEESGVMDHTHLRFFTKKSIKRMYENLGFKIITHKGINKTKSLKPYIYNLFLLFTAPDIFYVQYATVVEK